MRLRRSVVIATLIAIATARTAAAQEPGAIGVTMGFPASVGILWQIHDRVAVRPDFNWSWTRTTSSGIIFPSEPEATTAIGAGGSVLLFIQRDDSLRTYLSPRFSYRWGGLDDDDPRHYTVAGLLGAHYLLGRRFGVFGEIGVGYGRSSARIGAAPLEFEVSTKGVGTQGGVGVVLYF